MSFGDGAFVTTAANGGSILAAAMSSPSGVVAYENASLGGALVGGNISVDGRLRRAGNGEVGVSFLRFTAQATTALAVKAANNTAAIGAVDCGHFISAQTLNVAGTCVLPPNFGPGNGNWTAQNARRLSVRVRFVPSAVAIEIGELVHYSTVVAAGDITIAFKNCSLGILGACEIDLRYRHSIQS